MKRALDNNSKGQAKSRNECGNEELINLHREIEGLQRLISQVKGDWLDGLGLKELQQLEQKLETGLTRVRSEKEIKLREENKNLRRQIKELCGKALQDPESSECISNLEALQAYLEESSESDTSLQLGL
uniref:K-box domain-containing protein n=1 Tax=Picea sitchensis TaxID=3332 RepID=A9NLF7_PICSI|nr:unknown [Picea sitchensis]ABR17834.1 unknown [Picea sitchensis]